LKQHKQKNTGAMNHGRAERRVCFYPHHLFTSPSMAAVALMGRSANGWAEWKTPRGQTLDEVKRQAVKIVD
jgi:Domain of unknown function (DUF4357)